jgi:hypothetical protein
MILFSLLCEDGHEFEAWFRNGADFDRQAAAGGIACPICDSTRVAKALMAPAVPSATREGRSEPAEPVAAPPAGPPPASPPPSLELAVPDPRRRAIAEALRRIRDDVIANAVDVGDRFAEEARKIHYRESEPQGIYGRATLEEARDLVEEGIEFLPLPIIPDDRN